MQQRDRNANQKYWITVNPLKTIQLTVHNYQFSLFWFLYLTSMTPLRINQITFARWRNFHAEANLKAKGTERDDVLC